MAFTMIAEFEATIHSSLTDVFGNGLNIDDAVIRSVRTEALRVQRLYYWRHMCGFDEKMVIFAWMGLTFWRTEEEWAINWLGKDNPNCISSRAFKDKAREIIKCRQHGKITDLPPFKTAAKGPSKVVPAEKARIPMTGIIIKEPTDQGKPPRTTIFE